MSDNTKKAQCIHCLHFFSKDSNSTLKNHISHLHCEALKRAAEPGQSSMSRDGSIFVYNPDVLREQFAGLVIQRGLPFNHFDDEQTTMILDAEVQANEAIPLSDEEIALDAASNEGSMSGPGSKGEEVEAEMVVMMQPWNKSGKVPSGTMMTMSAEAKYMAEDASSKKFLASNFTNCKMTDSRPIMKQYNELLGILGRFTQHKMNMDEAIQEELTLVELDSHLRIEESLRMQDSDMPKSNNVVGPSVVNMVEHNNSSRYNDNKGKCKHHDNTKDHPNKKFKVTCWKCGKPKQLKKDYKGGKVSNKAIGSGINGSVYGSTNSLKGATVHVCKDRCWFKTYESLNDGSILHTGNESTALVHGRACVDLNNCGYKQVIEYNKFVLSKHAFMSTSKLNDSILWHARLGHVHFKRMQDIFKDGLISAFDMETKKCIECIFVGYAKHSKAFRFYVIEPNDSVLINSIIESRDVIFDENIFSSVPRPSQRSLVNLTKDIGCSVVPEKVTKEVIQQPEHELRKSKRNMTPKDFGPEFKLYLIEGTKDKDVAFWKEAFNDEMDSIMGNNTWMLADLPPVARISTIRLLIAMASIHNLIIHQMDVKTVFLNGDLDEEAPKQWHQKFDEVVLSNGYLLNKADKYVYSKFDETGKGVIIFLYVLHKGHGEADVILGIRIKHEINGIAISQSYYIENVLKKFNYFDCTPMDKSEKPMPNNGQVVSQLEYSRVIGYLMYAMTCTRTDIAFVVGKLSRYTSNPGTQHWQAIQRGLKYLKKTIDYRLTYTGYPSVLKGYTDANWINNTEDNSSTSGWVFLLGGGAISWASKKQTCITDSTIKYEFVDLAAASKKAEWLKTLLLEISL
nr:hypothetical protein [Tanacetum cinerariifolium]